MSICQGLRLEHSFIHFNTSEPKQRQYAAVRMAVNTLQAVHLTVNMEEKEKTWKKSGSRQSIHLCLSKQGWLSWERGRLRGLWNESTAEGQMSWPGSGLLLWYQKPIFAPNVPGNSGKTIGRRSGRQATGRRKMGGGKMQLRKKKKNNTLKWSERSIELTNLLATRQRGVQWAGQVVNTVRACLAPGGMTNWKYPH